MATPDRPVVSTAFGPVEPLNPYKTQSTALAASLVAAAQLEYVRAERRADGMAVLFVFDDPFNQGDILRRRFDAGMFPRVEPKLLFSARQFLVDEMSRVGGPKPGWLRPGVTLRDQRGGNRDEETGRKGGSLDDGPGGKGKRED
jgi:hypothetical protein